MIIDGRLGDTSDVPKNLRKYFSHASALTCEDGLILWGEALLLQEYEWAKSYNSTQWTSENYQDKCSGKESNLLVRNDKGH